MVRGSSRRSVTTPNFPVMLILRISRIPGCRARSTFSPPCARHRAWPLAGTPSAAEPVTRSAGQVTIPGGHTGPVRVLVAPDSFTGTLTAPQAAQAMAAGWARQAPGDDLDVCPLSDGGPGFIDALAQALPDARMELVTVPGPLGEPTPAEVLLAAVPDGVLVGWVESAQACGPHLVPPDRRDPGRTTTAGVAGLLLAARAAGARRIVVGLGGSGTNDAGAGLLGGLLADLGAAFPESLGRGGEALRGTDPADLAGLPALRGAWGKSEILAGTSGGVRLPRFPRARA